MLKTGPILLVLALTAAAVAGPGSPGALDRNAAPVLDVRVSVHPVADDPYLLLPRPKPDSFRCSVLVLEEPGSKRAWSTADVVVAPGESGEATSTLGALSLRFTARIDERGEAAETVVTVTRAGKIVSRQRTTVALRPGNTGRRYRPAE